MKETRIDGFPDPHNYKRWWDFVDQPIATSFPLETVTAGANANDDVAATLVGVIPRASIILGGYMSVSANSAGIDANNTSAWVIAVAASTAISKTSSAQLVANTPVALSTIALPAAAAGSAVTLAITNGTNADLNSAVCHTSLILADAVNYPAPGLKLIAPNAGTATISDGVKGIVALSPGAVDNDEIYMCAATETVKFASGESFVAEVKLQFSEANTDDANVIFGFVNAVGENCLVDSGAGPIVTGDYVALWKIDGGTKWYAGVQSNGTEVPDSDTLTDVTAGGSSYQQLKIKCNCYSSTRGFAEFWVDQKNVATYDFAYASATDMQLVVGIKNGSANAETLNVDFLGFADNRSV